jgi:hypothetical protein
MNGFAITITAFGSTIGSTIGSDNPSINPALMEPTETWSFTKDITSDAVPQVSDNTYLNSTWTVTSVDTDSGQVSPTVVPMQNGVANTHNHDVQQAQQSLASDLSAQVSDAATLNNDTSLSQAVGDMQKDYEQERSDWQTEQNTACSTDEVGGDADTVGGDLDDLNGDVTDLQDGDIKSVQTDLSNVASDLSTLRGLGAPPGTPSSAAVAAGNKALTSAANAISWANGQGQKMNAEAQALATTAQNYASSQCG